MSATRRLSSAYGLRHNSGAIDAAKNKAYRGWQRSESS